MTEAPHVLDRLPGAVERVPAPTSTDVLDRVRARRERRARRRRGLQATGAAVVVVGAIAAAVVVPRLGADGSSEVRTAQMPVDAVVLPESGSVGRIVARGDEVWVLVDAESSPARPPEDLEPSTLVRIDPAAREVTGVFPLPIAADQIALTDGRVWVSGFRAGQVVAVEAESGAIAATIPLRLESPVCDTAVCGEDEGFAFLPNAMAEAGGRVWVSTARGEVVGIDPTTASVVVRSTLEPPRPGAGAGTAEAYWVTMEDLGVARVDAVTGEVSIVPVVPGLVATGVEAVGDDLVVTGGPQSVVLSDGIATELGRQLSGVARDDDAIWAVDDGRLRRVVDLVDLVDPDVGTIGTLPDVVGGAVADGAYWATRGPDTVLRIDPDGSATTITVVEDPGEDSLAPVPDGTTPPAEQVAQSEIAELFVTWLASGESIEETAAMIEGGEELVDTIAEAQRTAFEPVENYSGSVESVTLVDEDRATVQYSILSQGRPVLTTTGEAVRVDGRWRVARDTYCDAIANGPTRCPPE